MTSLDTLLTNPIHVITHPEEGHARTALWVLLLVSITGATTALNASATSLLWLTVLTGTIILITLISQAVFTDFVAQWMDKPAQSKNLLISLTLMTAPLILFVPVNLLLPVLQAPGWLIMGVKLAIWISVWALQIRCIQHLYQTDTLPALLLYIAPWVTPFVLIGMISFFMGLSGALTP